MSGRIDISQLLVPPEKHEFGVAKFFADMGKDIIFLRASNIPGTHSPDILMDGVKWEIKCPQGKSKRTIEKNFKMAAKQSIYIIFDLRRIKVPESQCISKLKREFADRHAKRLLIITKSGNLIELPEKN